MHNRLNYSVILMILTAFLVGCVGSKSSTRIQTAPEWTKGESKQYPQTLFVTATGSASNPEQAKDRARGNLAKVFESRISETSFTSSNTQSHRSGGQETASSDLRLSQRINVQTDKILEGIRIAEQWHNSVDFTYHALAVLERKHAAKLLKDRMIGLDSDTGKVLSSIDSLADSLKKVAAYQRAISLQESRNNIQKTLKVIDIKGNGLPEKWNLADLKAKSSKELDSLRITAIADSKGLPELKQLLQAAMAQSGFTATDSNADYKLIAEVVTSAPELLQGWHWLRGSLNISLIDVQSGVSRGSKSWPLKVSASNKSQLSGRLAARVDKILKNELKVNLLKIATGE